MKLEIKVPSVGESVSSADIESWERRSGDQVKKGDILVILGTDKASMEIPAEQDGTLHIKKQEGETVTIGEVIGFIETLKLKKPLAESQAPVEEPQSQSIDKNKKEPAHGLEPQSSPQIRSQGSKSLSHGLGSLAEDSALFESKNLSPSVRRLVEIKKLNPSKIEGTGKGGRLTKEDILKELNRPLEKPEDKPTPLGWGGEPAQSESLKAQPIDLKGQKRERMTRLRRTTAQRLVQSQHTTATLSTFNEVDLSRIIEIRKNHQEEFVKKYGFKLGFMSFFVRSVVSALKQYPKINAFIEGEDIIYNDHQHIGIAISMEKGLVVPVLFHAETLGLAEIEKKIIEYKDKALARKLTPDDLIGGTFTISNGGVFGSLLSTPILNPPQSGILGMHKIEPRPMACKGKVEIRPMMYVTLSYDHRIVDGRESVGFLVKVKEGLEEPARLLVDI